MRLFWNEKAREIPRHDPSQPFIPQGFFIIPFSFILSSVLIPIITNEKTGMKNHARNHNIFVYQKPIPLREGDHRIYRNLNFVK